MTFVLALAHLFIYGFAITGPSIGIMIACQQLDRLARRIPPPRSPIRGHRHGFKYLWHFYSMTLGDLIGLSFVWGASLIIMQCALYTNNPYFGGVLLACIFIGAAIAAAFHFSCLADDHVPDWGYPATRKTSPGGWIHVYFMGITTAVALSSTLWLFWLEWDNPLIEPFRDYLAASFRIGLGIWALSQIVDAMTGRYARLKKEAPQ